jgi:uncharacterized protein YaaQ
MKMVMAVVPRDETECVLQALISAGHTATFVEGRGGVLRQAKKALFIAVQEEDLEKVLNIIQESCGPQAYEEPGGPTGMPFSSEPGSTTADLGSTVVFVWELGQFSTY